MISNLQYLLDNLLLLDTKVRSNDLQLNHHENGSNASSDDEVYKIDINQA